MLGGDAADGLWVPIPGYEYTAAEVEAMRERWCFCHCPGVCVRCAHGRVRLPHAKFASEGERFDEQEARRLRHQRRFGGFGLVGA